MIEKIKDILSTAIEMLVILIFCLMVIVI